MAAQCIVHTYTMKVSLSQPCKTWEAPISTYISFYVSFINLQRKNCPYEPFCQTNETFIGKASNNQ